MSTCLGVIAVLVIKSLFFHAAIEIIPYKAERDSQYILDMFHKNWYWLIENPEFRGEFYLEHMSPTRKPEDFGKEIIRMLYVDDKPAGFVTYYKENFYVGKIHFLLIAEEYRGRHFSDMLMRYAIDALKKMNAQVIRLVTRVNNKPARKLYEKFGFKVQTIEHGFVYYELKV